VKELTMTKNDKPQKPGSELARDEQREDATPRYHGGGWKKAEDEPPPGTERVGSTEPGADAATESGGDGEGMGRAAETGHGSKK
jgi:hypothetical protein